MKISYLFGGFILFFFIILSSLSAQDINVYSMIGKSSKAIIHTYGKPVHKDISDKEMMCYFYRDKIRQMTFVADKSGVYQAEAVKKFSSRKSSFKEISKIIKRAAARGFSSDTLNAAEFILRKKGVKVNLSQYENAASKKFEVRIKAIKCED